MAEDDLVVKFKPRWLVDKVHGHDLDIDQLSARIRALENSNISNNLILTELQKLNAGIADVAKAIREDNEEAAAQQKIDTAVRDLSKTTEEISKLDDK